MNRKSWIIIVIEALIFIALIGTVSKCSYDKINRLEHNIDVYRDSIEYVETQNNELITAKQSLILSEAELREELDISKREMKDLKKKLGDDIAYIAKLEAEIDLKDTISLKADTVFIDKIDSTTITKQFNWKDDWFDMTASIKGSNISDSKLSINKFNINVPLTVGLTDDYKFWVKTANPYVNITDINSAVIDESKLKPKHKRWNFSMHGGIGVHYGLFGQQVDVGPYVGYGISYNF